MSPCVNLYFPTTPTFNLIILIFIMTTTTTMMMMMMTILMMTTISKGKIFTEWSIQIQDCFKVLVVLPKKQNIFFTQGHQICGSRKPKWFYLFNTISTKRQIVFHFLSSLPAIERFSPLVISLSLQVYEYINDMVLWIVIPLENRHWS